MASQDSAELHVRMLRAWHLAILRFAVTRDNADRLAVFAVAREIDGLGRRQETRHSFGFFRQASSNLSAAILKRDETADAALRQYLAQIDDVPLRRTLAAALEIEPANQAQEKRQSRMTPNLWQGLPSRGNIRT
jgi:hypothetical protein